MVIKIEHFSSKCADMIGIVCHIGIYQYKTVHTIYFCELELSNKMMPHILFAVPIITRFDSMRNNWDQNVLCNSLQYQYSTDTYVMIHQNL